MRKKQGLRIVSSILAASMALTMMPTAAFAAGTADVVDSAVSQTDEVVETLVIKDGKPTSYGNETSGWKYEINENGDGTTWGSLTFYKGYTFDQNVSVDCRVYNYGTITAGTFKDFVINYEDGIIKEGIFETNCTNYGKIESGTFWADLYTCDDVQNADINLLNTWKNAKIQNSVFVFGTVGDNVVPEGAHSLTIAENAKVNNVITTDAFNNKVYVVGDRDVTVTYTGDSEEFDGWKAEPEVTFSEVSTDKKTVKFAAPDTDIKLTATEKVYPLEIVNGKPTGKGSIASGWKYENDDLTFLAGYTFDQNVVVDCNVYNYGTIKAGIFKQYVNNQGTIEAGIFRDIYGTVQNIRTLTLPNTVTVNNAIQPNSYGKVYVAGNNKVTVTYTADSKYFDGWKANPEVNWTESTDKKTVTFNMPDADVTLTAKEKVVELTFADGKPTEEGNKTSGWSYEDDVLTFYEGYSFNQDVIVNCSVENYGTITAGTFKQDVDNAGTITNGLFATGVNNYIREWVSDGETYNTVYHNGTITGGVFAYIREYSESGIKLPDNTHTLSAVGSMINDEILMAAFVVGDNQKVKVSYFGAESDFESWKGAEDLNVTPTETTIEFVMPAKDVALGINYKDNALEFGADGMPTHAGGKNWECVQSGEEAVLMMYDGAVLETAGTVKTMVVAYPGSIIRNGTFEKTVMTYGGTIENGIFDEQVTSGGTIQNGTFNDTVANMNIKMDKPLDSGNINLGINVDISECAGLITGGTFNKAVQNCGIIEGGSFVGAVYCIPLAEMIGKELEQQGITFTSVTRISGGEFNAEVTNIGGEITGGTFKGKVTNVGEIDDGVFDNEVKNTTSKKLNAAESLSDDGTAVFATTEAIDFAVDMQNDTSNETVYIGVIKGGTFTAKSAVSNESTIEDGSFAGAVENTSDGAITGGSYTGAVTSEGTIANGSFTGEVKNTGNGQITGGDFAGKVENNGKPISGGTFAEAPTGTTGNAEQTDFVTLTVPENCTINGKAQTSVKMVKGSKAEIQYNGTLTSWKWVGVALDDATANPITITLDSDVTLTVEEVKQEQPSKPGEPEKPSQPETPSKPDTGNTDKPDTGNTDKPDTGNVDKPNTDKPDSGNTEKPGTGDTDKPNTDKPAENPQQPANNDSGAGALIVGGVLVAGGVATGVLVYKLAVEYIQAGLPEGAEIPETREQLAVALWQKAGQPEVAVEEGVTLTDSEKAMRWAVENQLVSAEGEDSVSKIDVLLAVYKASKL